MAVDAVQAPARDSGHENLVSFALEPVQRLGAVGRTRGLQNFQQPLEQAVEFGMACRRHAAGERGQTRADDAEQHGADIDEIAVLIEKALFLVVEIGGGARMNRQRRAFGGRGRFDLVCQRRDLGDRQALRKQQPGQVGGDGIRRDDRAISSAETPSVSKDAAGRGGLPPNAPRTISIGFHRRAGAARSPWPRRSGRRLRRR